MRCDRFGAVQPFASPPFQLRLIHQPSGGIGGTSSDMMIQAEQVRLMRERLNQIFADATGQSIERIEKDTQRDFWLNTQEALDYGLLGRVIRSVDDLA